MRDCFLFGVGRMGEFEDGKQESINMRFSKISGDATPLLRLPADDAKEEWQVERQELRHLRNQVILGPQNYTPWELQSLSHTGLCQQTWEKHPPKVSWILTSVAEAPCFFYSKSPFLPIHPLLALKHSNLVVHESRSHPVDERQIGRGSMGMAYVYNMNKPWFWR